MYRLIIFCFTFFLISCKSCDFTGPPRKKMTIAKQFEYFDTRHIKNPHVYINTQIEDTLTFHGKLKDKIGVIIQMWDNYLGFDARIIYTNAGVPIPVRGDMDKHGNIELEDHFYTSIGLWKGYITRNQNKQLIFKGIWRNHQEDNDYEKFAFKSTNLRFENFIRELNDEPYGVFEYEERFDEWHQNRYGSDFYTLQVYPTQNDKVGIAFHSVSSWGTDGRWVSCYVRFINKQHISFDYEDDLYGNGWEHFDIYFKGKTAHFYIENKKWYELDKISNEPEPFLK